MATSISGPGSSTAANVSPTASGATSLRCAASSSIMPAAPAGRPGPSGGGGGGRRGGGEEGRRGGGGFRLRRSSVQGRRVRVGARGRGRASDVPGGQRRRAVRAVRAGLKGIASDGNKRSSHAASARLIFPCTTKA